MLNSPIELRPLTRENWNQCAQLPLRDDQRDFIPTNLQSIAVAQFYLENCCRAIYAGDEMVGFALYGVEQQTRRVKLFRLMISANHQGKGYGTASLRAVLADMESRWPQSPLYVSYHDRNETARKLYARFGFREVEQSDTKITAVRATASPATF